MRLTITINYSQIIISFTALNRIEAILAEQISQLFGQRYEIEQRLTLMNARQRLPIFEDACLCNHPNDLGGILAILP